MRRTIDMMPKKILLGNSSEWIHRKDIKIVLKNTSGSSVSCSYQDIGRGYTFNPIGSTISLEIQPETRHVEVQVVSVDFIAPDSIIAEWKIDISKYTSKRTVALKRNKLQLSAEISVQVKTGLDKLARRNAASAATSASMHAALAVHRALQSVYERGICDAVEKMGYG